MTIDPDQRAEAQALAFADLIDFLAEHHLDDRVAFTEIHNEVQVGHLADGLATTRMSESWRCDPAWSGHWRRSTSATPTGR